MLFPRNDPSKNPILYHYCSADSFLNICRSRAIWLSDINTMNDYGESHWAYDRFIEAANEVYDTVGKPHLDALDKIIGTTQGRFLPFVGCLSRNGDVLSQWRSYADSGKGVAVGFDAALLDRLAARIAEIDYDRKSQVSYFRAAILATHEVHQESNKNYSDHDFIEFAQRLGIDLCCFKNPSFQEEGEIRIIRAINVSGDSSGTVRLSDAGGTGTDRHSKRKLEVKFRSREGGIVSFVELPLTGLGNNLIKEVVIGPRSSNGRSEVSAFLTSQGFTGFNIRMSSATLR